MPKKRILGLSKPVLIFVLFLVAFLFIFSVIIGALGQSFLTRFGVNINLPAGLAPVKPEPELPPETVFHIGGFPVANTVLTGWISIIIITVVCWFATRRMKVIPGRLQSAVEGIVNYLLGFCQDVAGQEMGRKFFPIVATVFLFVITNAWLGLVPLYGSLTIAEEGGKHVPLLRAANTDVNVALALALVSFVFVTYWGVKKLRLKFFKQFFNFGVFFGAFGKLFHGKFDFGAFFTGFINIAVGLLELLSFFIRIVSFTFRLFGNMTAGELLLLIVAFLIPWVLAVPFYGLELLVGFVQALIFSGLTLVFATVAIASEHE